ncbi:hypothetical protein [Brevibacillus sp. H7]|uniref:hypothetical protein n=1 Tax=Brevibacillus sp. H7 TaxID=3349138 RepID=UPI00380080FC
MKKWLGLPGMLSLCLFIMVGIFALQATPSYAPTHQIEHEAPEEEQLAFERVVQRIFIGQEDERGSFKVVEFESGKFPQKPIQLAIHTRKAYVHVDVATSQPLEQVEHFFSQFNVTGNVKYSSTVREISENNYQLSMHFDEIPKQFALQFGHLPKITLKRMAPLQVTIGPEDENGATMLLAGEFDISSTLYVSEGQDVVNLRFSEPMVEEDQIGFWIPDRFGSWQDPQTFQLHLRRVYDKTLNLVSLYSLNGNYLPPSFQAFEVKKVPPRDWVDLVTGKKVGFSRFDSFYDALVFSPKRDRYVGLIDRGGSQGDGAGRYFAIVLEQQGKPPVVVEPYFYSDVLTHGSLVQWLDNERFAFATYYGAYVYHLANGAKQELYYNQSHSAEGAIQELAVDRLRHEIYLLLSYLKVEDGEETYQMDKWTYDAHTLVRKKEEPYSETFLTPKSKLQELPIHVRKNGVYYTKATDAPKKVRTTFVSREGSTWTVEGQVVWADHDGHAVLIRDRDAAGKPMEKISCWWEIGKKPQPLPQVFGTVQPLGPYVVSDDSIRYYMLDPKRKKWNELPLAETDVLLPVQEETALYRRDK